MTHAQNLHRRGITLMEVLISIGILAIGLSSVVALVPAGRSEAAKAVIMDRSANLAMNVLNDAVTFGLTRPTSFQFTQPASFVTFDLLQLNTGSLTWTGTDGRSALGLIKPKGVLASATDSATAALSRTLTAMITTGRDDVAYTAPVNDDEPPTNLFTSGNGSRQFLGRTTALVSVAKTGTVASGTLAPGELAKLTAVVFHNRSVDSVADAVVSGTYNATGQPAGTLLIPAANLPTDRSLKEIIRPGTVVYSSSAWPDSRWSQVAMASVDEANGIVYVTFVGDVEPPAGAVQIAVDSVGLAERIVTLEGPGPYGR